MKRICLVVVGLYINMAAAFAQVTDSAAYQSRKLRPDEINFVSSYYYQDGNNSAVTGGTGTEKLHDFSNNLEIKLLKYNKRQRKINLDINLGFDHYTSASSDKINPNTLSSASSQDGRFYPSVSYAVTDEKKAGTLEVGLSYSVESDYESYGIAAGFAKKSRDRNSEFTARAQLYLDKVEIILPVELRTPNTGGLSGYPNEDDYPWKNRNTISGSFTFARIINQRLQLMLLSDITYQHGFLGLPFHRIYFNSSKLTTEKLPASRFKIPVALRANYFLGDRIILRSLYRFYKDDWGLNAHTVDIETAFKISSFFSITPFYRYYTQSAIDYFAGYMQHQEGESYYSSNYDFSKFHSNFFGGGLRFAPPKGILWKRLNLLELRYGYYNRSNGLHAYILSLNLKYK